MDTFQKCIASNPNFIQDTVAAAELAYELKAEEAVQNFVDSSSNTLFGELANLVSYSSSELLL